MRRPPPPPLDAWLHWTTARKSAMVCLAGLGALHALSDLVLPWPVTVQAGAMLVLLVAAALGLCGVMERRSQKAYQVYWDLAQSGHRPGMRPAWAVSQTGRGMH